MSEKLYVERFPSLFDYLIDQYKLNGGSPIGDTTAMFIEFMTKFEEEHKVLSYTRQSLPNGRNLLVLSLERGQSVTLPLFASSDESDMQPVRVVPVQPSRGVRNTPAAHRTDQVDAYGLADQ